MTTIKNLEPFSTQFELTDKVALITGGAGLIGSNVAQAFASIGAKIAIVDIDGDAAIKCANDVSARNSTEAFGFQCDVSLPDSVAAMVRAVGEKFDEINILFNNAATNSGNLEDYYVPFEEFSFSVWQKIMSVNIDGMFLIAQAVGKQMVAQGAGGSIIQTSSIYGLAAPDLRIYEGSLRHGVQMSLPAVYSTSKSAVVGLSRYLSTYWADQNIRVNTLVPGGIDDGVNNIFRENYAARVPLGRMAKVNDMVGAVIFLASDASSYITGQELVVDGGWTVW
jgi:NAD(P)-dependent dehydrogenase (short-subunit alcohol dehydrogenase family)